jgi:hypothetical protein
MVATFQALAGIVLALLPGAAYTFAYERVAGPFGITLSDRLVRFLAASAVFHAMLAGPELLLYREFVVTGRLGRGDLSWLLVGVLALGYLALPTGVGTLVALGRQRNWPGVRLFGGTPEPRAWDYLWRLGVPGVVRLKLKSGTWLAGVYGTTATGRRSYAAGYPEPGDLYLSLQLRVDPATGEFARDDEDRPLPVPGGSGLLIRWSEIEYLEFQET